MNRLAEAVAALHEIDRISAEKRRESKLHPLSVLAVTVLYLIVCSSFGKYEIGGLSSMAVYLLVTAALADLSFRTGFHRLKYMFVLILLLGIVNPFLDRSVALQTEHVLLTGGMISMAVLFLKGVFMVYAVYFMVMRIGIEGVCEALFALHVPGVVITTVMLTYRYIIVLLRETERMWTAYRMRAPGQKGIAASAWGTFLGSLLLRSVDRGGRVYDSMLLRGYRQEKPSLTGRGNGSAGLSILYVAVWAAVFYLLRTVPMFALAGMLLTHG